ncbi:hypothetical protein QUB69_09050 [Microcoleus sp. AT13-A6]
MGLPLQEKETAQEGQGDREECGIRQHTDTKFELNLTRYWRFEPKPARTGEVIVSRYLVFTRRPWWRKSCDGSLRLRI